MVADLLTSRGHFAHNGPACQLQIHALVVRLSGDKEELLFQADEGLNPGHSLEKQWRGRRRRREGSVTIVSLHE